MSLLSALTTVVLIIGTPLTLLLGGFYLAKRIRFSQWRRAQRSFPPMPTDPIGAVIPDALLWLDIDGWGYGREFIARSRGGDPMIRPLLIGEQALHIPAYEVPDAPPLGWEGLEPLAIPWSSIQAGYDACHFIVGESPFATLSVSAKGSEAMLEKMKGRP